MSADPPVPAALDALLDFPSLRTEIGTVLRQVELTTHRADVLPPATYVERPTIAEWRERVTWLVDVLKRTRDALETEHLNHRRLAALLRDADEIRCAYGFLLMRMAVAKDAQDAYDVSKREFTEHEAALKRLEIGLEAALRAAGPRRTSDGRTEQLSDVLALRDADHTGETTDRTAATGALVASASHHHVHDPKPVAEAAAVAPSLNCEKRDR